MPIPECAVYLQADYLWLRLRDSPLPRALVTTGPPDPALPGLPGQAGTRVLVGGDDFNDGDYTSGSQVRGGFYSEALGWGADASGFWRGETETAVRFRSDAAGLPVLVRPFVNAADRVPSVNLVALPDVVAGAVQVSLGNRYWGAEANAVRPFAVPGLFDTVKVGIRYQRFDETLRIRDRTTTLPGGTTFFGGEVLLPGDVRERVDLFATQNHFYGGQVSFLRHEEFGPLVLDLRATCALGVTREELNIRGATSLFDANRTRLGTLPGGLLALPSNIGDDDSTEFAVMPEVEAMLGIRFGDGLIVSGGYSFTYWSRVVRPGPQINTVLNTTQVPISPTFTPGARSGPPAALWEKSDLWAHGLVVRLLLLF
jgi:hypothetical protein